ncbi:MAG TPA: PAS domain S-box protein, partial [Spirochaetia bacterium]|nr:PAS domain S-box protein [Spirochaetia bacterium]
MRILVKAPLALGLLIALYTVAMFVAGRYFIIPSFQNAQISSARRNLDRVMAAIDREGNYLAALGNSRSVADAADAVLPTEARTFLKQTGVDLIAVYAEDGALRFEARYDRQNDEVRPEALLPGPAPHDAPYVHHSGSTENIVGFIDSPQGVYIVASAPILRPGGSGRIRGSLVIGRLIDAAFSSDIQRQTSVHAQLEPVRFSRGVDPNALLKAGGRKVVVGDHGREIVAYGVESDLWGSPVLIVRAHISQEIGVWSRQTFRISVVMMLALALVFSAIQLTFLLRAVVRPLGMLQDHVREYEKDEAKSLSWSVSQRRDEIGGLAVAFEHMGQSLSLKRRELVSANETLEAKVEERTVELRKAGEDLRLLANVVESTGSSVVITDLVGRILKVNEAFCETSGYAEAELLGKNPRIMKSGRHDEKFYKEFWQRLTSQGTWQGEIWDRRKDGGIFPKWLTVNLVRDERGSPRCYVGVSSDLSSLKAAEERLRELAYFDPLTSLPNRSLFLDRLEHGVLHGLRYGDRQALLFIDLDRFKYV